MLAINRTNVISSVPIRGQPICDTIPFRDAAVRQIHGPDRTAASLNFLSIANMYKHLNFATVYQVESII